MSWESLLPFSGEQKEMTKPRGTSSQIFVVKVMNRNVILFYIGWNFILRNIINITERLVVNSMIFLCDLYKSQINRPIKCGCDVKCMYFSGSSYTVMLPRKKRFMKYGIVETYQSSKLGDTLHEGPNICILRNNHLHRCEIGINSFLQNPQMQLVSSYFLLVSQWFTLQCLSWYSVCMFEYVLKQLIWYILAAVSRNFKDTQTCQNVNEYVICWG
jgi:hypothetical protein